jgi:hypothetical protein
VLNKIKLILTLFIFSVSLQAQNSHVRQLEPLKLVVNEVDSTITVNRAVTDRNDLVIALNTLFTKVYFTGKNRENYFTYIKSKYMSCTDSNPKDYFDCMLSLTNLFILTQYARN